jgi:hypothetical protein
MTAKTEANKNVFPFAGVFALPAPTYYKPAAKPRRRQQPGQPAAIPAILESCKCNNNTAGFHGKCIII